MLPSKTLDDLLSFTRFLELEPPCHITHIQNMTRTSTLIRIQMLVAIPGAGAEANRT
jgi:hypothetical protein